MALARVVVVAIVGRRDLHGAGAEVALDDVIGDDRDVALHERDADPPTDQRPIARIVGVNGHRRVAEDRLGTGRGDGDRLVGERLAVLAEEVVADLPERARLGRRNDLEVRDARPAARAPVDERLRPVGQPIPVQLGERMADGLRGDVVHREAQPAPVEAGPDSALLGEHDRTSSFHERAHPLEVALATEALTALALLGELLVEHELGGDRGVVETGQPERGPTEHPRVADHEVLDRRALRVAEVEGARDVGRRLDDDERWQRSSAVDPAPSGAKTSAASQRS